jgi:oligosaccharide translocation protein RFT1
MMLIGLTILVFGVPYSRTLLFLYGGTALSDSGPGTILLQGNCVYIFIMAINGVTEAFTQAAMTQEEMDG